MRKYFKNFSASLLYNKISLLKRGNLWYNSKEKNKYCFFEIKMQKKQFVYIGETNNILYITAITK